MTRRSGLLALILLAPFALIVVGIQASLAIGAVGVAQLGWAGVTRSGDDLQRGAGTLETAATLLDRTWSSPAARLLDYNPLALGSADDLRATAHALAEAAEGLEPLASIGGTALGFDGQPRLVSGTTIDTTRLVVLQEPVDQLQDALDATQSALAEVPGSGPLGRPLGAVARSIEGALADLGIMSKALGAALPGLPEALGATAPKRYLICALNDAEVFASGGAPLSAVMVEADKGTISAPISGQLESKLSPNNPSIRWDYEGGMPWYRESKKYPFVNSDFHPDFRTAAIDIRRAWAALGYPEVDGVITVNVSALARILAWTGPIDADGYGRVSADSLIQTVLVDAYRQFNSTEGVLERHARNDALVTSLAAHMTDPRNVVAAARGVLDAVPPRHIQASFTSRQLQEAVEVVGATGALSENPGDLVGVYSQSGPNKLSVFQERSITQDVQLTTSGGAHVHRTITFTNAVPEGLAGDPTLWRGYLALRARMRVAYRLPLAATDTAISTGESVSLVRAGRTGPFPDASGGAVLWQGHETEPGGATTVTMEYHLPAGTFPPNSYEVSCDPQPLAIPTSIVIRVQPAPGHNLTTPDGWVRAGGAIEWAGTLDQPLHLEVGR
ncbi:MAG: DUF4012 domain-containing protein [Candidatus Nanopelagicales bacterium]